MLSFGFYLPGQQGLQFWGGGGLSNRTSGEHIPPLEPRVLPGAKRKKKNHPTQMNHVDLPWSILSAYYEKKIFLWILILL